MFNVSDYSKDTYITLRGLINKNNGFFRSAKQAKFGPKHWDTRNDYNFMESHFGFRAPAGTTVAQVDGYYKWAEYGSRSYIPGLVFFVFDDIGVTAQYTVGGNGNGRDGWSPNPKKCKLVWERPSDAPKPDFAKAYAEMDKAQQEREDFLAARPTLDEGRIAVEGVIKSSKVVHNTYGYHTTSAIKIVVELDNGNRVYGTLPSSIDDADVGTRIKFVAKVTRSDDDVHFGFYSRPSKAEIVETVN